jgi:purine-binding chemotaxis protein CheW
VPRAPHHIIGIVSVRGQLVTVVDLRRRLSLPESPATRKTRILLVDATGGEVMGVMVDEVLQVYRLAESEIEPAAAALGGEVASYLSGIARPAIAAALASTTVRAAGREAPVVAGGGGAIPRGASPSLPVAGVEGSHVPDASVVILLDLRAVLAS